MKRIYLFPIILLLSVVIYGCSEDVDGNQVDFDLITSQKLSSDPDFGEPKIEKLSSQLKFEETWTMYRLEEKIPNVNFDEKNVYFIGINGSGSCPYTIEKIITSKDREDLIVSFSSPDENCTTDSVPYIYVIQIDKNTSEEINNVKVIR